ncbi:MAG: GWxTD domain-containing protein [Candidatus Kapaibacterium sp.]
MKLKIICLALLAMFVGHGVVKSQTGMGLGADGAPIFMDALCFHGPTDTAARVDIYTVVPYAALQFMRTGTVYAADYQAVITVRDSVGTEVQQRKLDRKIVEKSYENSRGASSGFDITQTVLALPAAKYTIEVAVLDGNGAKRVIRKTRTLTVLDFSKFTFSLSGILLVSSLEEINGKYTLTPHISDNIARLSDGFFVFFESYSQLGLDSADFVFEVLDKQGASVLRGPRVRKSIRNLTDQQFMKIPAQNNLATGEYTLRILALRTSAPIAYKQSDYMAVAERSMSVERTLSGVILKDLDKSIRQLRHVATQSEIDNIRDAATPEERRIRFEEFWKKLDPTPTTERNEAFEEYYGRIEYANKNYRSYTEGWLTDMGMVFVVFGAPNSVERQPRGIDGRAYARWTYGNNRQFTFVDNSGFDDFRLTTPFPAGEKYRYSGY